MDTLVTSQAGPTVTAKPALSLKAMVAGFERQVIASALCASGGNQKLAARILGVLPSTLHEKIKRLRLKPAMGPRPNSSTWTPADSSTNRASERSHTLNIEGTVER